MYSLRGDIQKAGRPHWNSRRYIINNNPGPSGTTTSFRQVAGVRTTIGPHYNLLFDAAGAAGRSGKRVGRNFRGDESATRRANNTHVVRVSRSSEIDVQCRALMMQNRYRGHHYRGLTTFGRRASLCSVDQFCQESRRQPINVTTARRLTLAACNLYIYACVCICLWAHRAFIFNSRYFDPCWNDMYFTMVLSSCCHLVRSPVSRLCFMAIVFMSPPSGSLCYFVED